MIDGVKRTREIFRTDVMKELIGQRDSMPGRGMHIR